MSIEVNTNEFINTGVMSCRNWCGVGANDLAPDYDEMEFLEALESVPVELPQRVLNKTRSPKANGLALAVTLLFGLTVGISLLSSIYKVDLPQVVDARD